MKFSVNRYADFKAITNLLTTPTVIYSVVGADVQSVASFASAGDPYVYGPGPLQVATTEAALLIDYPSAVKVVSLSVT